CSRGEIGGQMAAMDGDGMIPLAVLLRREMSWERIEKPDILYGEASESKKGEDFTFVKTECQRVPGQGDTTFSVFAVMFLSSILSNAGGRLVISSDGVWDALTAEKALSCSRGLPAEAAAIRIIKQGLGGTYRSARLLVRGPPTTSNRNGRLDPEYPAFTMFKPFNCAICQLEMRPGEGISVHAGSSKPGTINPWDGPFLCSTCQIKKEAMEGIHT
ncbi:hypothetical protein GW17_00048282, partial [Ensete ventricosum]